MLEKDFKQILNASHELVTKVPDTVTSTPYRVVYGPDYRKIKPGTRR